jgi:hypothetical protein
VSWNNNAWKTKQLLSWRRRWKKKKKARVLQRR